MAMKNGRTILLGAMLLALAACGEKKQAGGGTQTSLEDATGAELARFQAEENARSQMTVVDAATSDAAAMPAEWSGPTAYDLRPPEAEAAKVKKEAAPVVEAELPSVAE
jgi:hypothetical protein